MAAALPYLAGVLSVGGTVLSHKAQKDQAEALRLQGERRKAEAEFEAKQLDVNAGEAIAVGHRRAADENLKTNLINSSALARAAASGAGASDPTVMNVVSKTAGIGSYRAGVALYEGESQARLDRLRAMALRMGGELGMADALAASGAANKQATATLLTGGAKTASLYSKYWSERSSSDTSSNNASGGSWLDSGSEQVGDTA